jgi:hypothetical protein
MAGSRMSHRAVRVTRASAALLAGLLLTAANAAKPLVIDDPVYVAFARQAAQHPTDPYGFQLFWYAAPEPAMGIGTVPAVLPYWLAGAMTLFGNHPVAWKLSLLPFALALTGSLASLLRRFAPHFATPVVLAIALGPSVLPGLNLMLDVPAIALGLLGYALFVVACERPDARIALASGLVLGLAMQTKYSTVTYPALVFAHAAIHRRPREGAVALLAAAALFVGWESLLFARYQQSHFLAGIERLQTIELLPALKLAPAEVPGSRALYLTLCLVSLIGGTLLFPGLLALVALGAKRLHVLAAALVAAGGFVVIALLPRPPVFAAEGLFGWLFALAPELFVFLPLGLCVVVAIGWVAARSLRGGASSDPRRDRVLVAWVLLEIVGYFAISPYPAVRRVIGLGVAAALLAARAAAKRGDEPNAVAAAQIAAAFGVVLGMLYFGTDLADASARRAAIARAEERLTQLGADRTREAVWYNGHWELQFYAEEAGMRAVVAGQSQLRPLDWLLLGQGTAAPPILFPLEYFRKEDELTATSTSPWSTISIYYDGPIPLRRQPEVQTVLKIFRVTRDVVPRLRVEAP